MPRLFNVENSWVKSFACASLASGATASQTWTGVTTDDVVIGTGTNTVVNKFNAYISAADVVTFGPIGGLGGGTQSCVSQTVWVSLLKAPTSDRLGGSL